MLWDTPTDPVSPASRTAASLFRFDTRSPRVEPSSGSGLPHSTGLGTPRSAHNSVSSCTDARVYASCRTAPGARDDNGPLPERSVDLTSYALDSGTLHANTEPCERPMATDCFCRVAGRDGDGAPSSTAPGGSSRATPRGSGRRDRAELAVGPRRVRDEVYRMMLLRVAGAPVSGLLTSRPAFIVTVDVEGDNVWARADHVRR